MVNLANWLARMIAESLPEGSEITHWTVEATIKHSIPHLLQYGTKGINRIYQSLKKNPGKEGIEAFKALATDPTDPEAKRKLAIAIRNILEGHDRKDIQDARKAIISMLDEGAPDFTRSSRGLIPRPPRRFIGRDEDVDRIKELILGKQCIREPLILTGYPGVGKTTLIAELANDLDLAAAFPDGIFWTALNQSPHLINKMSEWGRILGDENLLKLPGIDEASKHLDNLFMNRRSLIIVDDVWKSSDAWPFIVQDENCCSVISTRLNEVVNDFMPSSNSLISIQPLSNKYAAILFRILTDEADYSDSSCMELIKSLEGLPLSIVVAGRLIAREYRSGMDAEALIQELAVCRIWA